MFSMFSDGFCMLLLVVASRWSLIFEFLWVWEAPEGLKSSGRLVGTISIYFHLDPSLPSYDKNSKFCKE